MLQGDNFDKIGGFRYIEGGVVVLEAHLQLVLCSERMAVLPVITKTVFSR